MAEKGFPNLLQQHVLNAPSVLKGRFDGGVGISCKKRSMDAPEKESVHASCCIRMEKIAKSVIVRADDFQHLIEKLFHLLHQCELGAGTVKVVIRASNMEIMVALQIVGQKTDAAFQRHEPCAPCKALFFCTAHGCPGSREIPFGERFVQMQVKMDFALVRFVLGTVVGTGTDGIAEIVGRKPRHHGIEVNDTDSFSGSGVDQDIVDLGVVVGDAQRDFPRRQAGRAGHGSPAPAHE